MPVERATFYDEHPFDWVSRDEVSRPDSVVLRPLADLIQSLDSESLVLDIGCGPGRVLALLAHRGVRTIGLDRSWVSIGLSVERYRKPGVLGDNLQLPFASDVADLVISDGVVHHTDNPPAAFAENCRVLKPGGMMYLAVYKPSGRYPWIYKYPGELVRRGMRSGWSRPLVLLFAQLPYYLVHLFRSAGRRSWAGAGNLFCDYFLTPKIAFLSKQVVSGWCRDQGMRVVDYSENPGVSVHSFVLQKEHSSIAIGYPLTGFNVEAAVQQEAMK